MFGIFRKKVAQQQSAQQPYIRETNHDTRLMGDAGGVRQLFAQSAPLGEHCRICKLEPATQGRNQPGPQPTIVVAKAGNHILMFNGTAIDAVIQQREENPATSIQPTKPAVISINDTDLAHLLQNQAGQNIQEKIYTFALKNLEAPTAREAYVRTYEQLEGRTSLEDFNKTLNVASTEFKINTGPTSEKNRSIGSALSPEQIETAIQTLKKQNSNLDLLPKGLPKDALTDQQPFAATDSQKTDPQKAGPQETAPQEQAIDTQGLTLAPKGSMPDEELQINASQSLSGTNIEPNNTPEEDKGPSLER